MNSTVYALFTFFRVATFEPGYSLNQLTNSLYPQEIRVSPPKVECEIQPGADDGKESYLITICSATKEGNNND